MGRAESHSGEWRSQGEPQRHRARGARSTLQAPGSLLSPTDALPRLTASSAPLPSLLRALCVLRGQLPFRTAIRQKRAFRGSFRPHTPDARGQTPNAERSTSNAQGPRANAQRRTLNVKRPRPETQSPKANSELRTLNSELRTPNSSPRHPTLDPLGRMAGQGPGGPPKSGTSIRTPPRRADSWAMSPGTR